MSGAFRFAVNPMPAYNTGMEAPQKQANGGVILDISPEALEASRLSKAMEAGCRTCANRTYQDGSDDSTVSFQSPAHIGPRESASVVAAHEAEHVANEKIRAEQEGREIVSQTVRLKSSICPECGIVYISGGETRTVSRDSGDSTEAAQPSDGQTEQA